MDRNGDGDVSAKKFCGAAGDFRKLDSDCDGLLSSAQSTSAKEASVGPPN